MISVALPVYASEIAWLAMESLCNQKTKCKWELIIYEDEQYPLGIEFYKQYSERLTKANCSYVYYKYSTKRITLSFKWKEISMDSNPHSVGVILQAADNYSEPNRIQTAFDKLSKGFDWLYTPKVIFYQIQSDQTILYDLEDIGIGSDMAISRNLAIQLPIEIKWSSVDTWIFESINKIKPFAKIFQDRSDNWKNGIATDGDNRISLNRKNLFVNPQPPFYITNIKAEDCIPKEYIDKLKLWALKH